jgi:hypothetical protein
MRPAQKPSGPATFVTRGEKVGDVDSTAPQSQPSNHRHSVINLLLLPIDVRHTAGGGASVPSDYRSFSSLRLTRQFWPTGFDLGVWNLSHGSKIPVGSTWLTGFTRQPMAPRNLIASSSGHGGSAFAHHAKIHSSSRARSISRCEI